MYSTETLLADDSLLQISDIVDAKLRGKLMYDDHKLTASEGYFVANQVLRVFEEWVGDLEPDLQRLRSEIAKRTHPAVEPEASHIIESNWVTLLKKAETSCIELQLLIRRKRDEIQSLRDGVRILQCPLYTSLEYT